MNHVVTNSDTAWICLRHPDQNMFYWAHPKCANTYYKSLLSTLSWKISTTHEISWGESKVFAHIRDPLIKHRTGIIQYFYHNQCQSILKDNFDNDDFWLMLSRAAWLDIHTLTAWEYLREKTNYIHWIPLDKPNHSHLEATLDFVGYTGDRRDLRQVNKQNVSTGFKRKCVDKLLKIEPDPLIIKYLEHDRIIYDKAVCDPGFEPAGYQSRLAGLLAQGMTQSQAEQMLDQEIANGSYLQW